MAETLTPEQRDVDAAYRMAVDDYRDVLRSEREYGPRSPEAEAARAAYDASWDHYRNTKRLFSLREE